MFSFGLEGGGIMNVLEIFHSQARSTLYSQGNDEDNGN